MGQRKFVNPYNFIPFPDKKASAYEDTDLHTGVISYSVTAKTPLFIPNTSSDDAFSMGMEHKSYDFSSYNELEKGKDYRDKYFEPVIPGSELRGMIRSIYETLTDSCLSVFNDEMYPERRTGDVFDAGLIRRRMGASKAVYELYSADGYQCPGKFADKEFVAKHREGQRIYFTSDVKRTTNRARKTVRTRIVVDMAEEKTSAQMKEGYLMKGMPFGQRKKHCYLFEVKDSKPIKTLDEGALNRLVAVLDSYQSQPGNEKYYDEYYKELKRFMKGGGNEYFPVRYSLIQETKELLYLSPAAITKEIANTPLKKLLGDFAACETYHKCCPACDLFGMVGVTNEDAIGSKIRFSDAKVQQVQEPRLYYDALLTRELLGSPKLSNPEFYLVRPEGADFWTYDYYVKNGEIHFYSKEHPLRLRGRKYYFHQPDVVFPKDVERAKLNATIRPLKKGVAFEGKLYFENISCKQLMQLIWILNGGSDAERPADKALCYKLGSGKPLGFGSVELKVVSCEERVVSLTENALSYEIRPLETEAVSYAENGFSEAIKNDFLTISTLDLVTSAEVSYPFVVDDKGDDKRIGTTVDKGFEWFQKNKGNGVQKRNCSHINRTLPSIQERYLEVYEEKNANSNKQSGNFNKTANTNKSHQGNAGRSYYEEGQTWDGTVIDYYPKGMEVQLEGGGRIRLYFKNVKNRRLNLEYLESECPKKTKLHITYKGKNEQGYEQWEGEIV